MSRKEELLTALREGFKESLNEAFAAKFEGRTIETTYSLMYLRYVSKPSDGEPFKPEQITFIAGYEEAWLKASFLVGEQL